MSTSSEINKRISALEAQVQHYASIVAVLDGRREIVEAMLYRLINLMTTQGFFSAADLEAMLAPQKRPEPNGSDGAEVYTDRLAIGRLAQSKQLQEIVLPALLAQIPDHNLGTS